MGDQPELSYVRRLLRGKTFSKGGWRKSFLIPYEKQRDPTSEKKRKRPKPWSRGLRDAQRQKGRLRYSLLNRIKTELNLMSEATDQEVKKQGFKC